MTLKKCGIEDSLEDVIMSNENQMFVANISYSSIVISMTQLSREYYFPMIQTKVWK